MSSPFLFIHVLFDIQQRAVQFRGNVHTPPTHTQTQTETYTHTQSHTHTHARTQSSKYFTPKQTAVESTV